MQRILIKFVIYANCAVGFLVSACLSRELNKAQDQTQESSAAAVLNSQMKTQTQAFSLESLMQQNAKVPTQRRGVWLTHVGSDAMSSKQNLRKALIRIKRAGLNTVYPVIWNKGYTTFPSKIVEKYSGTPIDPQFKGRDVLAEIIQINTEENLGLSVIPWFEYGLKVVFGKAKSPEYPNIQELSISYPFSDSLRKKGQLLKNKKGEDFWYDATSQHFFGFLNPLQPANKEFLMSLVSEVINLYPVDGFQIDDHFSIHAEFGYNPEMFEGFHAYLEKKNLLKYDFPNTPKLSTADQAVQEKLWTSFRADTVAQLATEIGKKARSHKRQLIYQVSPAGGIGFSYKLWLQNWRNLVEERIVQEVVVQAYREDLPQFKSVLNDSSLRASMTRARVSVGIFTGYKGKPAASKLLIEQVAESLKRGLGINFFYYDTLFTRDEAEETQLAQAIKAADQDVQQTD